MCSKVLRAFKAPDNTLARQTRLAKGPGGTEPGLLSTGDDNIKSGLEFEFGFRSNDDDDDGLRHKGESKGKVEGDFVVVVIPTTFFSPNTKLLSWANSRFN